MNSGLYRGATKAAWGYLFLYLDIQVGGVTVLPAFVGYILFWQALDLLAGEDRDLSLLRPLCLLLGLWHGAAWLYSWTGGRLDGLFQALDLIVEVTNLYFHFQLFTDLAGLAAKYQTEGMDLDRRLLRLRTVQALVTTALALAALLPMRPEGPVWWSVIAMAAAGMIVAVLLMQGIFALRRCFLDLEAG